MITLKSPREIDAMEKAGAALAAMHLGIREFIKPGISSWKIEEFAGNTSKLLGLRPSKLALRVTSTQPVSVSTMRFVMVFPVRTWY